MSLHNTLKTGCFILGGIAALLAIGLALLVYFSGEADPEYIAEPPPMEATDRQTLDEVLNASGLTFLDLRQIGMAAPLDLEANHRAIVISEGRVRLLSLQNQSIKALPSLTAWTALETLVIPGNQLATLPDLSTCSALTSVDASRNQIATLNSTTLPPNLKSFDLSENPLGDLSSLAALTSLEKLTLRQGGVTDLSPLVDLPLASLDLRDNPIKSLPEKLPTFPRFRVDLEGCPVSDPPGYLREWNFKITESGVVGGRQTSEGMVMSGSFRAGGTWQEVVQLTSVSLITSPLVRGISLDAVELEVSVDTGTLRVYLTTAGEPRGPWFEKGFVEGSDRFLQRITKSYADAAPGKPARLRGHLERIAEQPVYFHIEPVGEEKVTGMSYRVWRD